MVPNCSHTPEKGIITVSHDNPLILVPVFCICYFSITIIQTPGRRTEQEEAFILSHSFGDFQSITMGRAQHWTAVQNSRSKSQKGIRITAFLGDISFGKEFQKRCARLYLTHTYPFLFYHGHDDQGQKETKDSDILFHHFFPIKY